MRLKPDDLPPPRQVTAETNVTGHDVFLDERVGLLCCRCGERQPSEDGVDGDSWRRAHLANVWPEFVPRSPDESTAEWIERILVELDAAQHYEAEIGGPMVAITADGEDLGVSIESLLIAARIAGLRRQLVQAMMALG